MKTATLIRDNLPDFRGHAALYRCNPPIEDYEPWEKGQQQKRHEYIIASATTILGAPETYLFPSNAEGEVVAWERGELYALLSRVRLEHGLQEVRRTWGVGMRELQREFSNGVMR